MIALELTCLAIVVTYVAFRPKTIWRLVVLALAGWLGENTCIALYGFYAYSPKWSLFIDHVPLMIVVIWPVVIHSGLDLAERLLSRSDPRVPYLAAAIVFFDASLIEPIAVEAGLWHWTEPGLFRVPPIGILGWSLFALCAIFGLRMKLARVIPVAVVGVHAGLLLLWWGFFRWVNGTVPPWPAVACIWVVSLAACWLARTRRIPKKDLLLRIPGALFFFVLLGVFGLDRPALVAYALAFAPPYLVLTLSR